jgi:hypothetical protein
MLPGVSPLFDASLVSTAAIVLIGVSCVGVLVAGWFHRRHQAQLSRLAVRHSMSLTKGSSPAKYAQLAGRYQGADRKASLSGLMLGATDDGLFCAARKMGRARQQFLYFELDGSARLDGFYVSPGRSNKGGVERLTLHWTATRAQWGDQSALSMAARVMYSVSSLVTNDDRPRFGVELQGRKVWVHSLRPLRGTELDNFVDDAMKLRQFLRKSLERTNGMAQRSARVRSVSGPVELVHG